MVRYFQFSCQHFWHMYHLMPIELAQNAETWQGHKYQKNHTQMCVVMGLVQRRNNMSRLHNLFWQSYRRIHQCCFLLGYLLPKEVGGNPLVRRYSDSLDGQITWQTMTEYQYTIVCQLWTFCRLFVFGQVSFFHTTHNIYARQCPLDWVDSSPRWVCFDPSQRTDNYLLEISEHLLNTADVAEWLDWCFK